jgi:hypothetical protein
MLLKYIIFSLFSWLVCNDKWNWLAGYENNKENLKTVKIKRPRRDFLYLKIRQSA